MFEKLKKAGQGLGLLTSDDGASADPGNTPGSSTPASSSPVTLPPLKVVSSSSMMMTAGANPEMVNKLKASVLGSSPILGQFMQNVEIARKSFPGDDVACMRAALAFTSVDKATLTGELDRTVASSLILAKKGTETERKNARASAVGRLENELQSVNSDIERMNAEIAELQNAVTQKKMDGVQLQGRIQNAEADLQRQDGAVNASFAQVEQFIASLKQTISTL